MRAEVLVYLVEGGLDLVYDDLPARERSEACIFTGNYGEASALNFPGGKYGLPSAIRTHNSYWLWGPGSCSGRP